MDLIRTGIGIGKTIRNVGRLKEIVLILVKHGFSDFLFLGELSKLPGLVFPKSKIKIKDELEKEEKKKWAKILGIRLRNCFEELGPTFIKLGQLLSTREDIFDQDFINEMKSLRDNVKPIPFSQIRGQVEKSLSKKIEEVFSSVEETPVGMASIGVVFKGILLNGDQVAIKVKRPNIDKLIEIDFSLLKVLVGQAEKMSTEIKFLGISRIIREFGSNLQTELNFNREALNADRLRDNLGKHDENHIFYIPKVYREYSNEDLLITEYLNGIPFSNQTEISKHQETLYPKLEEGVKLFIKTFLKDGFFHADLHGGNFFLLPNGKLGLVDFGIMGNLSIKNRQNFLAIIYSIITYNFENLVYEFLDVAEFDEIPDVDSLISDVKEALSPFIGLTVSQTNFSQVLKVIVKTLNTHQLFLPREWYIVFRAFITLDGVGKSLSMDFDIYGLLEQDIYPLIKSSFGKDEILEEALWIGKDFLSSLRMVPRQMKWFLKHWSKNNYAIEIKHNGHQESFNKINDSLKFLGFVALGSVFFISGNQHLKDTDFRQIREISIITWVFWIISFSFITYGLFIIRKKRKY